MTVDVEQNGFARLSRWYSDPMQGDMKTPLPNEALVTEALFAQIYANLGTSSGAFIHSANQNVFIQTAYKDIPNDRKFAYQLFYDADMETVGVDGRKVYDLYLRATVSDPGENVEANYSYTDVFDLNQFLSRATQIARSEGDERIYIRLNYANSFNADTTEVTYKQAEVAAYPVFQEQ